MGNTILLDDFDFGSEAGGVLPGLRNFQTHVTDLVCICYVCIACVCVTCVCITYSFVTCTVMYTADVNDVKRE